MSQQTQLEVEVNSVATKTTIIGQKLRKITRRMLRHINLCCDIIKS